MFGGNVMDFYEFRQKKTYNLFISHAWKYDADYCTVVSWLDDSDIKYKNYSVPSHDPLDANNTKKLKEELTGQISPSSVVIVISGMYAAYSQWIDYEIDEAIRMNKTILGLEPWGSERIPRKIQDCATEMIRWQRKLLIDAIKRY